MRFAFIGDLAEAAYLAQGITSVESHSLGLCFVNGPLAQQLTARGLPFELVSAAEEVLLDSKAETVVIALKNVEESIRAARQASQAGHNLVVIPPDQCSTAFSYELHLLLDESDHGILPFLGRWYLNSESDGLRDSQGKAQGIRQLRMDLPLKSEIAQERAQLHAIDAIFGCGFTYDQITGLDLAGPTGHLQSRTITLASNPNKDSSGLSAPPATLSFRSEYSADIPVDLQVNADAGDFTISSALPEPHSVKRADGEAFLPQLVRRLADPSGCQAAMSDFSNSLEAALALEKSLRRRRTVDIYFDAVSERGVFKTQMTAIGCGVLAYVAFGMIVFLIVAQLSNLPPMALQIGRIVWISPVVLFLLAQLLLPLAREHGQKVQGDKADKTSSQ